MVVVVGQLVVAAAVVFIFVVVAAAAAAAAVSHSATIATFGNCCGHSDYACSWFWCCLCLSRQYASSIPFAI